MLRNVIYSKKIISASLILALTLSVVVQPSNVYADDDGIDNYCSWIQNTYNLPSYAAEGESPCVLGDDSAFFSSLSDWHKKLALASKGLPGQYTTTGLYEIIIDDSNSECKFDGFPDEKSAEAFVFDVKFSSAGMVNPPPLNSLPVDEIDDTMQSFALTDDNGKIHSFVKYPINSVQWNGPVYGFYEVVARESSDDRFVIQPYGQNKETVRIGEFAAGGKGDIRISENWNYQPYTVTPKCENPPVTPPPKEEPPEEHEEVVKPPVSGLLVRSFVAVITIAVLSFAAWNLVGSRIASKRSKS